MSDSASIMPEHPPVTDWVHDFDHTDPRWTNDPFPIWDELRAECPVVHTKRFLENENRRIHIFIIRRNDISVHVVCLVDI